MFVSPVINHGSHNVDDDRSTRDNYGDCGAVAQWSKVKTQQAPANEVFTNWFLVEGFESGAASRCTSASVCDERRSIRPCETHGVAQ